MIIPQRIRSIALLTLLFNRRITTDHSGLEGLTIGMLFLIIERLRIGLKTIDVP